MLIDEHNIIRRRWNSYHQTQAMLTRAAAASIMSSKGGKQFNKLMRKLSED